MNKFYKLKSAAKIGSLVCALVVIDLTFPIASAMAAPLTYDYTVKIKAGPLAGDIFAGTFIVDSASVASGQGNVSNLTLNLLGTVITQSEGIFGLVPTATFAAGGSLATLSNFVVISTARATAGFLSGGIFLPSPITSFKFAGGFNYGIDPNAGENIGGGTFAGSAETGGGSSVPEPATLLILGTFLAGLGVVRYRRTDV